MLKLGRCVVTGLWLWRCLAAQEAPQPAIQVSAATKPPRLIHKVEPKFTPIAQSSRVQGNVVLQLIVDEKGSPKDIIVISPLGFGLDESAEAAVRSWQFVPGEKNGVPVPIVATV